LSVMMLISAMIVMIAIVNVPKGAQGRNSNSYYDNSAYGMSMQRDWMYDSGSINMKYEGCVWGLVDQSNENLACMEGESGDGTVYWYQMAECRRAQVAYSLYTSSSSNGAACRSGTFKESFMTKDGVAEFAYTMGNYGYNSPISDSDTSSFPVCDSDGNGFYLAVGCASDGRFTIDRFTDAYCTTYYDTYDYLSNFNNAMKKLSCYGVYSTSTDEDPSCSLATYIVGTSGSCSQNESSLCTSTSFVSNSGSYSSYGSRTASRLTSGANLSLTNRLKYGLGSAMLLGSVVMFFGILFTNRKKRRAMMHRKFRNSSDKSKTSRKSKTPSNRKTKKSSSSKKVGGSGLFA
jgi:hypothetical protein